MQISPNTQLTEQDIEDARELVRRHMILLGTDHPWLYSGVIHLDVKVTLDVETLATDGTRLYVNPLFVRTLNEQELIGVLAHETLHCVLCHPYRMDGRDSDQWNIATDYAINWELSQAGVILPAGGLLDSKYAGMAAERIYALLPLPPTKTKADHGCGGLLPAPGGTKDGGGTGNGEGEKGDGKGTGGKDMTEVDWQIVAEQAALVGRKAGNLPGNIDRALKASRQSETDWKNILHRFAEQNIVSDRAWSRPDRRFIGGGMYLPGLDKANMPRLGLAIDTSGSCAGFLQAFANEFSAILQECRPEVLIVVYADMAVKSVEEFTPDDGEVTLTMRGGGGTDFKPALEYFSKLEEPVAAVVYLTDLEGDAGTPPTYPVLWAVPEWGWVEKAPFGELVRLPRTAQLT